MFDKKLNSLKLGAHQIESAFSPVGGTQPTESIALCGTFGHDLPQDKVKNNWGSA